MQNKTVVWYNSPLSKAVSTNFEAQFLKLLDQHFPKGSTLGKCINRNIVKVSYSCLPNMEHIIYSHNKRILRTEEHMKTTSSSASTKPVHSSTLVPTSISTSLSDCNCRRGTVCCPLNGECLSKSVLYKAEVAANGSETHEYMRSCIQFFQSKVQQSYIIN